MYKNALVVLQGECIGVNILERLKCHLSYMLTNAVLDGLRKYTIYIQKEALEKNNPRGKYFTLSVVSF